MAKPRRFARSSARGSFNRPEPPTIGSVATLLALDRATLTANLKPPERGGLLRIVADPKDKGVRRLVPTDRGRTIMARAAPIWTATHAVIEARLPNGRTPRSSATGSPPCSDVVVGVSGGAALASARPSRARPCPAGPPDVAIRRKPWTRRCGRYLFEGRLPSGVKVEDVSIASGVPRMTKPRIRHRPDRRVAHPSRGRGAA